MNLDDFRERNHYRDHCATCDLAYSLGDGPYCECRQCEACGDTFPPSELMLFPDADPLCKSCWADTHCGECGEPVNETDEVIAAGDSIAHTRCVEDYRAWRRARELVEEAIDDDIAF